MNNPLVSIFMITYNHGRFIEQALKGAINQKTDFPYRLVIGEDCSSDNTREIVKRYAQQYPHKIHALLHPRNLGQTANAREVFKACTGKYIAFLEGDDYWTDPLKLQKQVDFLEANPDFGLVHTDLDQLDMRSGDIQTYFNNHSKNPIPQGKIFNDILNPYTYIIKTVTAMLRREVLFKHYDFDLAPSRNWMLADLAMWLEISWHSKIGYIPDSTAVYRVLPESASQTGAPAKQLAYHRSVYEIRFYFWEKYSKEVGMKRILDRAYHIMLLGNAYKLAKPDLARDSYAYMKSKNLQIPLKQKLKYLALGNLPLRWSIDFFMKIKNRLRGLN